VASVVSAVKTEPALAVGVEIAGLATDRQVAAPIASETATSLAAAAETATPLVEVPEAPRDTTAQALAPVAVAAAAALVGLEVVAAGGAGKRRRL